MSKIKAQEKNQTADIVSNRDWALSYARKGWRVFPLFYVLKDGTCSCRSAKCKRIGKHPITKNGLSNASSDEATVRDWWTRYPAANIGLATGHDGLMVTDTDVSDVYKAGEFVRKKEGPTRLAELEQQYGALPETLTVRTGSDGRHYWFFSVHPIPNSQDKVAPDIDVRGQGGYVILPPSNHKSGGKYEWINGPDGQIADCPPWLEARAMPSAKETSKLIGEDTMQPEAEAEVKKKEALKYSPDQIVKLLDFIPADCDRDTWWKIGAALKVELGDQRGFEAFDAWSQKAPDKYDPKNIHVQWASFDTGKGITGGTIAHYAKEYGFRGFAADGSALSNESLEEIAREWVYFDALKLFYRRATDDKWEEKQIDNSYPRVPALVNGKIKPVGMSEYLLHHHGSEFRKVHSPTYLPGCSETFVRGSKGVTVMNLWKDSDIAPAPGRHEPFVKHIIYLIPNERERYLFLAALAYIVQRRSKLMFAVLLQGQPGTGKSWVAGVLQLILGVANCREVENEELTSTFNDWIECVELVVINEIRVPGADKRDMMDRLKTPITQPTIRVNAKHQKRYEMPTPRAFLCMTNDEEPIYIEDGDRRWFCLNSPAAPQTEDYYEDLFRYSGDLEQVKAGRELTEEQRANLGAIRHFLENYPMECELEVNGTRELVRFNGYGRAPETHGREDLLELNRSDSFKWVRDSIQNAQWPFTADVVRLETIVEEPGNLPMNLRSISAKKLSSDVRKAGGVPIGHMELRHGLRKRCWAVRNVDRWQKAADRVRGAHWEHHYELAYNVKAAMDEGDRVMVEMIKATRKAFLEGRSGSPTVL